MGKNPPAKKGDTRDMGSVPGSGRFRGRGNSNPLQYSSLENSMDRGVWWAIVHKVEKSWTRQKYFCTMRLSSPRAGTLSRAEPDTW